MSEEKITSLLEEIRDLQKQQLELSQKSFHRYEQTIADHKKEVSRGKKAGIAVLFVLLVGFALLVCAEWAMDGIPKQSWMK